MEQRKLLYVDKALKVVSDSAKGIAVVELVKEQEFLGESLLKGIWFNPLINIAFLSPIGHDKSLIESEAQKQEWTRENYPAYVSTLISAEFCYLARRLSLAAFYDCWTRSREDEGYPCYRTHPVLCQNGVVHEGNPRLKMPNVYVSLVMLPEDFVKINPNIRLDDYYVIGS